MGVDHDLALPRMGSSGGRGDAVKKQELEARIAELEKQVRSLQSQLNNVMRPQPAPIFVQPYSPGDKTSVPTYPAHPLIWNIC